MYKILMHPHRTGKIVSVAAVLILALLSAAIAGCAGTEAKPPSGPKPAYPGWQLFTHDDFRLSYPAGWSADANAKVIDRYQEKIVTIYSSKGSKLDSVIFDKSLVAVRSGGVVAALMPKNGAYVEVTKVKKPGREPVPVVGTIRKETDKSYAANMRRLEEHVRPGAPRNEFGNAVFHPALERPWCRYVVEFSSSKDHYQAQVILVDDATIDKGELAQKILRSIRIDGREGL